MVANACDDAGALGLEDLVVHDFLHAAAADRVDAHELVFAHQAVFNLFLMNVRFGARGNGPAAGRRHTCSVK